MGRVRPSVRVRAILGSALFSSIFCVPKSNLCVGILNSPGADYHQYATDHTTSLIHATLTFSAMTGSLHVIGWRLVQ